MREPTKGEIIERSLKLLSDKDRHTIQKYAEKLQWKVPIEARKNGQGTVQFGPRMAYELLWSVGKYLNEENPQL